MLHQALAHVGRRRVPAAVVPGVRDDGVHQRLGKEEAVRRILRGPRYGCCALDLLGEADGPLVGLLGAHRAFATSSPILARGKRGSEAKVPGVFCEGVEGPRLIGRTNRQRPEDPYLAKPGEILEVTLAPI